MAKVCKYYIRGTCKYGSRCHFLHENDNQYYQEDSYESQGQRNYDYDKSSRYTSHDNSGRYTSYDNNGRYTSYNPNRNYNRYHVDNRYHNINQIKSISEIPFSQIMDLILRELQQFEERHVWKLTAIAPLKGLGNIPIFRDFSPEEMRYQYYECQKTGSTYEYERKYKELIDHVQQCCLMFSTNSQEAQDLIKNMVQQSTSQNEEMHTEFTSMSAPSNPIECSSPRTPKSFNASTTSNPLGNSVFGSSQNSVDFSVFSSNEIPDTHSSTPFLNHSIFGTSSIDQLNSQSNSKLNSFSFDLRSVRSATHTADPVVPNRNIFETNSNLVDSVYSKLEELPLDVREAFQARTFKYGQVPLMAPPKEMCFG